ncbi:hypothetical protein Plhal304r1_c048g0130711 [Plasmopara halstedii]
MVDACMKNSRVRGKNPFREKNKKTTKKTFLPSILRALIKVQAVSMKEVLKK